LAVAFVGVADDIFLLRRCRRHRPPFDAGGESCAAAAAQARIHNLFDRRFRPDLDRLGEALIAAMGFVIFEAARIDDTAMLEGEAGLVLEERNLLDQAEAQAMRLALEHAGADQLFDIGRLHRPETDAAFGPFHFNKRLQPIHAARAGAHDLDVEAAFLRHLL
jgi:hypothetical protein